jgi:hypothetical protein
MTSFLVISITRLIDTNAITMESSIKKDTVVSAVGKGRDVYMAGKDAIYEAAKAGRKAFAH